jgi:endonuclease/exonuclease/phosphatase (EEP) superfamily protein YafD
VLAGVAPWVWFAVRGAWPPLDVVAIGVPLVGPTALVLFGLVSARTGRLLPVAAGLSIFLVAAVSIVSPRLPQDQPRPREPIRVAAANVLDGNPDPRTAASVLARRDADLLVMIEVDREVSVAVEAVSGLPEALRVSQFSIRARWPLEELPRRKVLGEVPWARLRVDRPGSPFVLYVVHARNPLYETTFEQQEALANVLTRTAEAEPLPAVVVGDLNLSDRAEGYRIITGEMRDAMRAGSWPADTYRLHVWQALFLRIDHLFVPAGWCAADPATFDVPGSDHRGIEATIGLCP